MTRRRSGSAGETDGHDALYERIAAIAREEGSDAGDSAPEVDDDDLDAADEEAEARILRAIADARRERPEGAQVRVLPDRPARSKRQVIALVAGVAAAAAIALFVIRQGSFDGAGAPGGEGELALREAALPAYEAELHGGAQRDRGDEPEGDRTLSPGDPFTVTLRPERRIEGMVEVEIDLVSSRGSRRLTSEVELAEGGFARVRSALPRDMSLGDAPHLLVTIRRPGRSNPPSTLELPLEPSPPPPPPK